MSPGACPKDRTSYASSFFVYLCMLLNVAGTFCYRGLSISNAPPWARDETRNFVVPLYIPRIAELIRTRARRSDARSYHNVVAGGSFVVSTAIMYFGAHAIKSPVVNCGPKKRERRVVVAVTLDGPIHRPQIIPFTGRSTIINACEYFSQWRCG